MSRLNEEKILRSLLLKKNRQDRKLANQAAQAPVMVAQPQPVMPTSPIMHDGHARRSSAAAEEIIDEQIDNRLENPNKVK